jgi:hypothetical protein
MDFMDKLKAVFANFKVVSAKAWENWLEITILIITLVVLLSPIIYFIWNAHANKLTAAAVQQKVVDDAQSAEIRRLDTKIDNLSNAVISGGKK